MPAPEHTPDLRPGEPRANREAERHIVNLNTASEQELAALPMVRSKGARQLITHRPYRNWEEVEQVPGFNKAMVDHLRSCGTEIVGGRR